MRIFFQIAFFIILSNTLSYGQAGMLDSSFGGTGIVLTSLSIYQEVNALAMQQDGKVVVCGSWSDTASFGVALVRYQSDGSLDTTFDHDGKLLSSVNKFGESIVIQPDGKIVVGGSNGGQYSDFIISRYNTDGAIDSTFNGSGIKVVDFGYHDFCTAISLQPDGKIIASGYSDFAGSDSVAIARLNTDGTLDSAFSNDGMLLPDINDHSQSNNMVLQQDQKIVNTGSGYYVARVKNNGTLDSTFNGVGFIDNCPWQGGYAMSLAVQPDKKIIVVGTNWNNIIMSRCDSSGIIDSSFGNFGIVITPIAGAYPTSIFIQSDGKILISTTRDDSVSAYLVARFNINGTIDNSFGLAGIVITDLGSNFDVNSCLTVQQDGKIVTAGTYNYIQTNNSAFGIVRYRNDLFLSLPKIISAESKTLIVPNPFDYKTTLYLPVTESNNSIITVYDETGRLLFIQHAYGSQTEINLEKYSKGVYIVQVNSLRFTETIRLVKQ